MVLTGSIPKVKKYTLSGSRTSWPIGVMEAEHYPAIALCEGGPDFLAAFGHMWAGALEGHIAPVCMSTSEAGIA